MEIPRTETGSIINFDGNSNYNDGLWYEGWEGNYDLVKLNLRNEEVIELHVLQRSKAGWKNLISTACALMWHTAWTMISYAALRAVSATA